MKALHNRSALEYVKTVEGREKMRYSDFEYILCNYVFRDAILFPNKYSGVHHLVIQGCFDSVIMITINRNETVIRVSYDDAQYIYSSYEEALDEIKKHCRKWK